MSDALWYLGRGTGVTALVLFSLVMVLGVVTRSGSPLPGLPRFAVAAVHRTTSLSAVVFLVLHVLSLLSDPYAQLRWFDAVVPFVGTYRPVWQGLGTLAADLVVVLVASSLLRRHLGLRTWRVVHTAAYLCWPVAVAHVIGTGTDAGSAWLLAIVALCIGAVVTAVVWRVVDRRFGTRTPPVAIAPPAGLAGLR